VSFSDCDSKKGRIFNNADSFAISFDESWKKLQSMKKHEALSIEEKIKLVLGSMKDHPFIQENKSTAYEVAKFRIKLLNLD
tara:strand:+ start:375 stop:617 length:243 start_codon:yes stop_codon:yes gene_type:complete